MVFYRKTKENSERQMRNKISILLKSLVILSALIGSWLNIFTTGFQNIHWNSFLFFTIQSNIWIAVVMILALVRMLKGKEAGRAWSAVMLVFTISITLTGMVYCFILAPTMAGNAFTMTSNLVHVFSPALAVLDYLVCCRDYRLEMKDTLWVIVPPLYYLVFAAVGYVCNWNFGGGVNYPYFFLNWGSPTGAFGFSSEFPFMGVMWYVLFLLVALWLFGLLYYGVSKLLKRL